MSVLENYKSRTKPSEENLTDIQKMIINSASVLKKSLSRKLLSKQPTQLTKEIILRHAAQTMLSTVKP